MTAFRAAVLLKKWHYNSLYKLEQRFIDDIVLYAGNGSENVSNADLMKDNEVTQKMINYIWRIARRFMITPKTMDV